ncbi:MAG: hypothetical protein AB7P21_18860 [Lautropia sp.]
MNHAGDDHASLTVPDPSLAIVDLLDALASYRAGEDVEAIDWVSACLLRIAGEQALPSAVRMLANQLYVETCAQAGAVSGQSFGLLSTFIH